MRSIVDEHFRHVAGRLWLRRRGSVARGATFDGIKLVRWFWRVFRAVEMQ